MTNTAKASLRVLLLHNFMTPYRIPLFAELARRVDLEVWVLGDVRRIREWTLTAPPEAFRCRFLRHISLPAGSRDYRILINYTLPFALRKRDWDVILCGGWDSPAVFYSAAWASVRGVPWVLWSGSTAGEPNWRRTLSRPVVRTLVRAAKAWVVYGSRSEAYLVGMGAEADRVWRAYNTVDTEEFAAGSRLSSEAQAALKQRLGIATPFVVMYCGQLIDRKGMEDLLPAFARLAHTRADITLLIVGSGGREAAFREQCRALGINGQVVFAGFVARAELPPYYGIADLFTLPSRQEVWGLVINEALACGVPVLTTDSAGASPDLIRDGVNGYVIPASDPAALADALTRHFEAGTDRTAMRAAARESIQPFSIVRAADALETAIRYAAEHG